MEEEHSTINNSNEIVQMTSSTNSHRLQIRRNISRQTTTLRSLPYNSSLSNLRRRQNSLIASQTINNLITNIENNTSSNNQHENEENLLDISENENNPEDFQVLVDFSNTSPITNENNHSNESYHSLSTIDFDPDNEDEDEDDDDDDQHHHFYYTSTSPEPLIVYNNPIDLTQYQYDDEYSPSINNNNINDDDNDDDEDLSIEIILENSQNNSLSPISRRRRHSIISSNNRGLRLSEILNIPQKIYSSFKQQINDKSPLNTECYICLEDFQLVDSIKILNCQHIFHTGCINEWLRMHSNCAYCRAPVVIDIPRAISTTTGGGGGRRQRTRTRRNLIRSSTFEQQP